MTSTDTYQLKWHSHSTHLNGSVASLLRSERFTDVVLCTMDGSQIPAHKFILSSCSVYLSCLFDGQRPVMRMSNAMLYVVLPPEISTKALQVLVEYMYKGETTVSTQILDTVLKAGEVLKIRGLWRQTEDDKGAGDQSIVEKPPPNILNKHATTPSKSDETSTATPKIAVKKDDKLLKTFSPMQPQNAQRPMFLGPKLLFIKTNEANTNLRQIAPKPQPQGILMDVTKSMPSLESPDRATGAVEKKTLKKYGKKPKMDKSGEESASPQGDKLVKDMAETEIEGEDIADVLAGLDATPMVYIKAEPDWKESEGEDVPPITEDMFHTEMTIKSECEENIDIDEDLMYSPLTCELCAEVFTVPAAWVRHIESHASAPVQHRKRKIPDGDDTDETLALLRCDLCQKHFLNPAEWVRHIQNTHTETELALSNNSAPPTRHNRFTGGEQTKHCPDCDKSFPSHASMVIHRRTHTGEKPYICGLCNKGFNVKSNLLRHLRTLHDSFPGPDDFAEISQTEEAAAGPSGVAHEPHKPES